MSYENSTHRGEFLSTLLGGCFTLIFVAVIFALLTAGISWVFSLF